MRNITYILKHSKTIAVVGLSSKRLRPSYGGSEYMQRAGYRIIPVNPAETYVLGEKAYPDLESGPDPVDIGSSVRAPGSVRARVESAMGVGARSGWMDEDVSHEEAAVKGR